MKLTVLSVGESRLTIKNMDSESVMAMVEAFGDPVTHVMAFQMDEAMVYVNKANIIRIDVD